MQMVRFHPFWWLSNTPLYIYTISSLSIHLLKGISAPSTVWLLWTLLLWYFGTHCIESVYHEKMLNFVKCLVWTYWDDHTIFFIILMCINLLIWFDFWRIILLSMVFLVGSSFLSAFWICNPFVLACKISAEKLLIALWGFTCRWQASFLLLLLRFSLCFWFLVVLL